jgi:hypothetical protein
VVQPLCARLVRWLRGLRHRVLDVALRDRRDGDVP